MAKEKYYWKGVEIFPYETFSRQDSEKFFRGSIGGYSKAIIAQQILAILVKYEKKSETISTQSL